MDSLPLMTESAEQQSVITVRTALAQRGVSGQVRRLDDSARTAVEAAGALGIEWLLADGFRTDDVRLTKPTPTTSARGRSVESHQALHSAPVICSYFPCAHRFPVLSVSAP